MKNRLRFAIVSALWCAVSMPAQERLGPTNTLSAAATLSAISASSNYVSGLGVVLDAQSQALGQARQAFKDEENTRDRVAVQTAIKDMERSLAALEQSKKSPEELVGALAAEQAAYQALLKTIPREYRMSRSRSRNQRGSSSGQPSQQELDQLEMTREENRYETERQAAAAPTQQQREQAQTLDRLKQLARRQQDLNDRLRDLQTALQEARTEQRREEIQRQLKRLREEERQLLADVDELRQRIEQSPDAARQADARQQLDQTRTDVQRAAHELERQSVSEALAAGSRAEQNLQTLRDNLRRQTSSQFTRQMRQLRNQARDLANQEDQIARDLDAINNSPQKTLDDSSQRKALAEQMTRQQTALTNLLGQMRTVTEQAETTEPLLSKQLYDILRHSDQMHTENQLEVGAQLVDRGFLPQASQAERSARQNIDDLRRSVDRAAESVLGSETEALRFAEKELSDLASQVARDVSARTNMASPASAGASPEQRQTNALAKAGGGVPSSRGNARSDTNAVAGTSSDSPGVERQAANERNLSGNPQGSRRDGEARAANARGNRNTTQQGGRSSEGANTASAESQASQDGGADGAGRERLRQLVQQLNGGAGGLGVNGPITGNNYLDWSDRMRDVEEAVDSPELRNQLATVRERVGAYRRYFRQDGRVPSNEELQSKVLAPLTLAQDWVRQELSRAQNDRSLVPLDRDPVPDKFSELVRQYYEKLGSSR